MRIFIECPETHSPLKAGCIFADCSRRTDSSCSSAADHTYFNSYSTHVRFDAERRVSFDRTNTNSHRHK